jgi:hypothetical protein
LEFTHTRDFVLKAFQLFGVRGRELWVCSQCLFDKFIVYLMTLSVAQTIYHRILEWKMNGELETTWRKMELSRWD